VSCRAGRLADSLCRAEPGGWPTACVVPIRAAGRQPVSCRAGRLADSLCRADPEG
jgi:hypothetical protein